MRALITKAMITAGVLAASFTASAQVYNGPGYDNGSYRDGYRYDGSYRNGNLAYQGGTPVDQVRADLDRLLARNYERSGGFRANNWDMRLVNDAQRDLVSFQAGFANGRFERRELDEAIGRLSRTVNSPGLRDWERNRLMNDIQILRDFRASNRGNGYGYGYRR